MTQPLMHAGLHRCLPPFLLHATLYPLSVPLSAQRSANNAASFRGGGRRRTEDAALLKKTSLPLREWGEEEGREGGGVKERVDWDGTTTFAEESIFCIGRAPSASQSSSSVGALRGLPHNGSGSVFGFVQGYPQFDVGSGIQLDGRRELGCDFLISV